MDYKEYVIVQYLKSDYKSESDYYNSKIKLKAKLIEDLESNEMWRVLGASKILVGLDNLNFTNKELESIKNKVADLPKSEIPMMRDYRVDVGQAVSLLEYFSSGAKCKCNFYGSLFPPEREIEIGYLILNKPIFVNNSRYETEYELTCRICKTKWKVVQSDGYHFPTYGWEKI
jgi:hypothetical protein